MHTINADKSVSQLADNCPGAWRVLARHGLVWCCSSITLVEACAERGVPVDTVVADLNAEAQRTTEVTGWMTRPIPDLLRYLQSAYHRRLEEGTELLELLSMQVAAAHRSDDSRLTAIAETVARVRSEFVEHLRKEETVLFPSIMSGADAPRDTVASLIAEHREAHAAFDQLRALTDDFTPPAIGSCKAWRALYHGLSDFRDELDEHTYLEDTILFSRVLAAP